VYGDEATYLPGGELAIAGDQGGYVSLTACDARSNIKFHKVGHSMGGVIMSHRLDRELRSYGCLQKSGAVREVHGFIELYYSVGILLSFFLS
jgi:hypothetical protein